MNEVVLNEGPKMNFIGSGKFSVNMDDVLSVLKAAGVEALIAFIQYVSRNIGKVQMGEGVLIFLPMLSVALNAALEWVEKQNKEV